MGGITCATTDSALECPPRTMPSGPARVARTRESEPVSSGKNTYGYRLVRSWRWLDPFASFFGGVMSGIWKIPGTRPLKSLLHGTWPLGHPLHPAVTDLTIGGYTALLAV